MKRMHPIKPGDFIVIGLVAVLSVATFFAVPLLLGPQSENDTDLEVVVTLDGEEIHRFPLEETEETREVPVPFTVRGEEYTAVLEMKDGAVRMQRLPEKISPLRIHVDMGWISEPNQMIISLPVRLVVTIEADPDKDPENGHIDTLVY